MFTPATMHGNLVITNAELEGIARRGAVAKRVLDVAASATGLVLLSPVLIGLAATVKAHDGGAVIYASQRVGKDGRGFRLYKFRTMIIDADRQGPGITTAQDRRITKVGAWLRRFKLDELPQLWNVLKGEMSLVGPRPEDSRYVAHYTPEQRQVLAVRPGITGAASLAYRSEERLLHGADWETHYLNEIMPAKLALELDYLRRRTLWTDVGMILRTIIAVFKGEGR